METKQPFFTDWEGPWITTDFAYEISKIFLENPAFFERLSQYDDYLYFVEKKRGYNAGDTLRLLAPFVAVFQITSKQLRELAAEIASFVPDAKEAMEVLQERFEPVVISTSYVQYLEATAEKIGVEGKLHGTRFEIEKFSSIFDEKDRKEAERLIQEISTLPEIRVDVERRELISGFDTVTFLNNLFWNGKPSSFVKKIREVSEEIRVVGGKRKLDVVKKYKVDRFLAIGDSISDFEMLGWVKDRGLAVSFNGNEYSLMRSNLAIVSNSAFSEAAVVEAYFTQGMVGVRDLVKAVNSREWSKAGKITDKRIVEGLKNSKTEFYLIEDSKINEILSRSIEMRKALRGDAGKLG